MKSKIIEKPVITDKETNKNEPKILSKAVSPKNIMAKGLVGWKSQKDLHKFLNKNPEKSTTGYNESVSSQITDNNDTIDKKSSKPTKDMPSKPDLKSTNSPKPFPEPAFQKAPHTRFFRAKNSLPQKQDQNTRKFLQQKQQNEQKYIILLKKNQELQNKIEQIMKQKDKYNDIIVELRNQKEGLEKNMERLKNVASQNKKLLREKAEGFNNCGSQIMSLRMQVSQLMQAKKTVVSCSEMGVNTQVQNCTNQKIDKQYSPYKQIINPELQTTDNPSHLKILQSLHCFLQPLQQRLHFYQQTIYEQQKQLNQLYQQRQSSTPISQLVQKRTKLNLQTSQQLLYEMRNSQLLLQRLQKKQKQCYQLREELWNKDRNMENYKIQVQVKGMFQGRTGVNNGRSQWESEVIKLSDQIGMLRNVNSEKQARVKQFESKISQQQIVIRSLHQKRSKQIIK